MRIEIISLRFLVAGILLITASLPYRAAVREGQASLRVVIQSCHEDEFEFLFNADARARFTTCEMPLVGFDVMLLTAVGPIANAVSDENGQAVLEVPEVSEKEILRLAICKKDDSCISYGGLSVAEGPLKDGENFVLYLDGREGE